MLSSSDCHLTPWLTDDSGSNFRLPFHPHHCHHLGWPHHLCRGIIQQSNLTLLDLLPKCPCLLLQATCCQGHTMELCHSELVVQSLATTLCSSSFPMPHSHNTGSLISQSRPPPFSPFILLCPSNYQTSHSLPSLDPMLDHLNCVPTGTLNSLVLLSFYYHCPTKPQPWLKATPSSFQFCIVPLIWY